MNIDIHESGDLYPKMTDFIRSHIREILVELKSHKFNSMLLICCIALLGCYSILGESKNGIIGMVALGVIVIINELSHPSNIIALNNIQQAELRQKELHDAK
jgi:hypothetical protein